MLKNMGIINVLLIDDSNIVHLLLEKILKEYEDIQLTGEAYDGIEGIKLVHELSPDIIIMDINMPKMNGLKAISVIMESKPVPIIVFSSASREIVDLSLKAIDLGAVDILEKPGSEDMADLKENIKKNLIPKIRSFSDFRVMRRMKNSIISNLKANSEHLADVKTSIQDHHSRILEIYQELQPAAAFSAPIEPVYREGIPEIFPLVVIGTSTGGPKTLQQLFRSLKPQKIRACFVVVQHIADGFVRGFADWLQLYTSFKVKLAEKGELLVPQIIYIAPQGHHLEFTKDFKFAYSDAPAIHGIRPSATLMFASAARVFRQRVISLVLTGMGEDGSEALSVVKENRGIVLAQDEGSSLLYGMPKAALETGYVDTVLSLSEIPVFLNLYCKKRV